MKILQKLLDNLSYTKRMKALLMQEKLYISYNLNTLGLWDVQSR